MEIYNNQGGTCHYSGISLIIGDGKQLYSPSIERMNNCLPFNQSNICYYDVLQNHVAQGWS
jgi:predicted phage tail protein